MKKRKNRGFTLAELLIVIAIMAVLIGIAVPVFTAQLEKAKQTVDDANVRTAQSLGNANFSISGCFVTDCDGGSSCKHRRNSNDSAGQGYSGVFDPVTGTIIGSEKLSNGSYTMSGYNQVAIKDNLMVFQPGTLVVVVTEETLPSDGKTPVVEARWWSLDYLTGGGPT